MAAAAPFDSLAAEYDGAFTASAIGRRMRAATWRRIDTAFHRGDRVLELNCGTGEDAVHLARRGVMVLATDQSPQMVAAARTKIASFGLTGTARAEVLGIEELAQLKTRDAFDGVLSNFGGLNCVDDLEDVAASLGLLVRPRARAVLCVMGPWVPWEWGWYLASGQPDKALRRLRRSARWRGATIRYPSIGQMRRAFAPYFRAVRVSAVGVLVPPSYAERWAGRHPRVLEVLDWLERRVEAVPPLPWLADHYLLEMERTDVG